MLARLEGEEEEDLSLELDVASELEKALEAAEELTKAANNRKGKSKQTKNNAQKQRSRIPKQDSSFVDSLIDVLDLDFDEDFDESGKRNKAAKSGTSEKQREGKADSDAEIVGAGAAGGGAGGAGGKGYAAKKEEVETCETATPSNKVKVCVPEFETRPQRLHFYSQETYDEEYCYYKTLTICDIGGADVKRDVCTFNYVEKTHNVPATNVCTFNYVEKTHNVPA